MTLDRVRRGQFNDVDAPFAQNMIHHQQAVQMAANGRQPCERPEVEQPSCGWVVVSRLPAGMLGTGVK